MTTTDECPFARVRIALFTLSVLASAIHVAGELLASGRLAAQAGAVAFGALALSVAVPCEHVPPVVRWALLGGVVAVGLGRIAGESHASGGAAQSAGLLVGAFAIGVAVFAQPQPRARTRRMPLPASALPVLALIAIAYVGGLDVSKLVAGADGPVRLPGHVWAAIAAAAALTAVAIGATRRPAGWWVAFGAMIMAGVAVSFAETAIRTAPPKPVPGELVMSLTRIDGGGPNLDGSLSAAALLGGLFVVLTGCWRASRSGTPAAADGLGIAEE